MLGVCQKILADSDYAFSNLFFSIIKKKKNSVVSIDSQISKFFTNQIYFDGKITRAPIRNGNETSISGTLWKEISFSRIAANSLRIKVFEIKFKLFDLFRYS